MTIRRAKIFAAFLGLGLFAGAAQAQVVQWIGEAAPVGTHQLPNSAGCSFPSTALNPTPTCVTLGASYNLATMELSSNPGIVPTWSVTPNSGKLPNGLTLDPGPGFTSAISGIPTVAGVYSFKIRATLSGSTTFDSIQYTIVTGTGAPVITTTALPGTAVAGTPVPSNWYTATATGGYPCVTFSSQYCSVAGTTPYYAWSLAGGTVDGLGINPTTGAITGTPLSGGTFSMTIQATDGIGQAATPFTTSVTVGGPSNFVITTTSLPNGTVNTPYSQTINTTGGLTAGLVFTVVSGSLPPPITTCTVSGTSCILSGTPAVAGTYNFSLQGSFNSGSGTVNSNVQPYTVVISPVSGGVTLPAPAAQSVAVAQAVTMNFTATGGTAPYTYSLLSGTLPPGVTLAPTTGVLSGPANTAGAYNFTIRVVDSATPTAGSASASSSVTVGTALSLPVPAGQTVTIGQAVTMNFTATGGSGSYTYALLSGTLPPGLSLNTTTGAVTGTIGSTATGAYAFTVQVSDSLSAHASALGSITVTTTALTINTPAAVTVLVGQSPAMQFTAAGGVPPYTYTVASGALPPGVTLSGSTGAVSGSATTAGTYTFTVKATDSASATITTNNTTITANAALTMATPAPVTGLNGNTLTMQFTAAGGTSPYTYTITDVTLNGSSISIPSGGSAGTMTINSAGLLSFVTGTTTPSGAYAVTVKATDSVSAIATATGTLTLGPALTMANPTAITNGTVGQPLTMQFTAAGGTPPYTYAFQSGTLPPGLNLNTATGLLSGTPTAGGNYGFIIQATDSATPPLTATAQGTIVLQALSLNNSNVTITLPSAGGGPLTPNTQPAITLGIAAPLSQTISGILNVTFQRTFDSAGSREVVFANSANAIPFTIAAGQTQATFQNLGTSVALQVGTAAGSGSLTATFKDSVGNNITPPTLQPVIFAVAATAPVITCSPNCGFRLSLPTANTTTTPGGTYTATIVGYSSTLGMSTAVFDFTPTTGTQLSTTSVTVNVQQAFQAWYGNSGSNQTGGQFRLTIPLTFSVSGGTQSNPIAAATVTLTNSQGTVKSVSVVPQ